jgi:hypothetical protein
LFFDEFLLMLLGHVRVSELEASMPNALSAISFYGNGICQTIFAYGSHTYQFCLYALQQPLR